ncbi:hypothetical protein WJX74_006363 [Apatococcus lobatus]|uniref:SprT-like domain-containing protein n=1 Tax=Apatococcus lobatus TaxID=904363 RepID=A0AAW1RX11_9CHLO
MSENLSQYSGSSARLASLLAEFGIQSPHGQKPSTSPSLDSIESSPSFFSAKSRSEESAGSYDGAECVIPVASPLAECLVPRCSIKTGSSNMPCSAHGQVGQQSEHAWASSTPPDAEGTYHACNRQSRLPTAQAQHMLSLQQCCSPSRSIQPAQQQASPGHTPFQDVRPPSAARHTYAPVRFAVPLCSSALVAAGFPQQDEPPADHSSSFPGNTSASKMHDTGAAVVGISQPNVPSQPEPWGFQDSGRWDGRPSSSINLRQPARTFNSPAMPFQQQPEAESVGSPEEMPCFHSRQGLLAASRRLCLDSDTSPDQTSMPDTTRTLSAIAPEYCSGARAMTADEAVPYRSPVSANAVEETAGHSCNSPDESWLLSTRRAPAASKRLCLSSDSSPELPGRHKPGPMSQHGAREAVPGSRALIAIARGLPSTASNCESESTSSTVTRVASDRPSENLMPADSSIQAHQSAARQSDSARNLDGIRQTPMSKPCAAGNCLCLDSDSSPEHETFSKLSRMPAHGLSSPQEEIKCNQHASYTSSTSHQGVVADHPQSEWTTSSDEEMQPSVRRPHTASRRVCLDSDSSPEQAGGCQAPGKAYSIAAQGLPSSRPLAPATSAQSYTRSNHSCRTPAGNADRGSSSCLVRTPISACQRPEAGSQLWHAGLQGRSGSSPDSVPYPIRSTVNACSRAHFALHSSPESLSEAVQDSIRSVARGRSSWAPSDSSPEVLNDAATSRHDTGPGTRGGASLDSSPDSVIILDHQAHFKLHHGLLADPMPQAGSSCKSAKAAPACGSSVDGLKNGAAGRFDSLTEGHFPPPLTPSPKHSAQSALRCPEAPRMPLISATASLAKGALTPSRPEASKLQRRNITQTPAAGWTADQENQVPRTPFTPVARPPQTPAMASRQMPAPASRSVAKQLAAFRKERAALARDLYCRWNREVFASQLPSDLDITWNNNLRTTAGLMHYKRQGLQHLAEVDLSSKVLDCRAKLEATLAHEMCHAGAWVIDHVSKPPHGAAFQRWVGRFRDVRPDLDITTCHSYEVHYAFRWQCTNAACRRIFKRHSNSIDVSKQVCGACKSKLQSLGRFQADGTPARSRAPTPFSMFVKERFGAVKAAAAPGTPHGDLMRSLSQQWQQAKASAHAAEAQQLHRAPQNAQKDLQASRLEAAFAEIQL